MNDQSSASQFVTCSCQNCNGHIEFDSSDFRKGEIRTVECPHCHLDTLLFCHDERARFPLVPQKLKWSKRKFATILCSSAVVLILTVGGIIHHFKPEWITKALELCGAGLCFVFGLALMVALLLVSLLIYFLPFIFAWQRKKINTPAIFVLNFLLGWTFVFWALALTWSCARDDHF